MKTFKCTVLMLTPFGNMCCQSTESRHFYSPESNVKNVMSIFKNSKINDGIHKRPSTTNY